MDCCSGDELLTQLLEDQLDHIVAADVIAHVEACVSLPGAAQAAHQRIDSLHEMGVFRRRQVDAVANVRSLRE